MRINEMITEGNCSDSLSNSLTQFLRQMTLVLENLFQTLGLTVMVKPPSLSQAPHHIYLLMYPRAYLGLPKMMGNKLKIFQPHCIKQSTSLSRKSPLGNSLIFGHHEQYSLHVWPLSQINGNSSATHLVFLSLGLQGTFLKELASSHCP